MNCVGHSRAAAGSRLAGSSRLAASLVLLLLSSGSAAWASEEARALYSSRFSFDRRGVPLITVRVMEGQRAVTLTAPGGLRLLPLGSERTAVTGLRTWTVRLVHGHAARGRHWSVLQRVGGALLGAARGRLIAAWKSKGISARLLEVGTVFSVGGRLVDHRTTLVVANPDLSPAVAAARASRLAKRLGRPVGLHHELLRPSGGRLVAVAPGTGVRVVSRDVLWFGPVGRVPVTVRRVEYGRGYRWHGFADRRYQGRIYVTVDRRGRLAVVNEVPADHLLFGLVPAEIYTSAPLEALKAQAVAARGQLLAKIGTRHTMDPYLICSAQHCQVYSGVGREHARTTRAVRETRGLILVDARGRLADTVYSANAGGFTENNEKVWNTPANPNLRGRLDAPDYLLPKLSRFVRGINEQNIRAWLTASPPCWSNRASVGVLGRFRWTRRIGAAPLARMLRKRFGSRVRAVRSLQVLRRGVSGRAVAVRFHVAGRGALRTLDVQGELTIRRLLGNLKSSMFVVDRERSASGRVVFVFRGGGWGHGVGMCQTGAIGMAEARRSFRQILAHYYSRTRLIRLY